MDLLSGNMNYRRQSECVVHVPYNKINQVKKFKHPRNSTYIK